ncbi:hypothetical protein DRN74_01855 [Candidatus Micrarchaeota archaeon]|nr:MAG: hypothetical protein DRN74_01855 [Candidatus Micrarchaeota archaeon]
MAIFKKSKLATKDIQSLVLEMITKAKPKEEVIQTLTASGLSGEEAEMIYESAKKEYEKLLKSEIGKAIQKAADERKQEIIRQLEEEMAAMEKELKTHLDLEAMKEKQELNKKLEHVDAEVGALKSELFSVKMDTKKKISELESEVETVRLKGFIKILLSIVTILASIVMALFSVTNIYKVLANMEGDVLLPIVLYLVVFIGAVMFTWLGVKVYRA